MRTMLFAMFLAVTTIGLAGAECESSFEFIGQSKYQETESGHLVMVTWIGVGLQAQIMSPGPPDSNDDSLRIGLTGFTRSYAFMEGSAGSAQTIHGQNLSRYYESEECQTISVNRNGVRFDCTHMGRVKMSSGIDDLGEYWSYQYLPSESVLITDEYKAAEQLLEKLTDAAINEVTSSLGSK